MVVRGGRILGKPSDLQEARRFLRSLQGTQHRVITGVALIDAATGRRMVGHAVSRVTMRPMSPEEIARYARRHRDKAGAYAVQEKRDPVVTKVEGSYTNVVGLPLELVQRMLSRFLP